MIFRVKMKSREAVLKKAGMARGYNSELLPGHLEKVHKLVGMMKSALFEACSWLGSNLCEPGAHALIMQGSHAAELDAGHIFYRRTAMGHVPPTLPNHSGMLCGTVGIDKHSARWTGKVSQVPVLGFQGCSNERGCPSAAGRNGSRLRQQGAF